MSLPCLQPTIQKTLIPRGRSLGFYDIFVSSGRQNEVVEAEAGPSDSQSTESVPKAPETPSFESSSVKSDYLPKYLDIGKLSKEDFNRDDNVKPQIMKKKWETVDDFSFPARDALYCACCVLFGNENTRDKSFVTTPVSDWSNIHNYIKRHERLEFHSHNDQCSLHFVNVKESKTEPITSLLSTKQKEDIERNRHILSQIIDVLILCGRQNIAIRGHTPEKSNFMAILRHTAKQDEILKSHLDNQFANVKYTSPDIQNEILKICGEIVRNRIVCDCNKANFFALIGDEATDVSTQ
ncbi:unnamed protein product [Mytilus coruscus]|uniref:DUF4371 domain-containing protein n=1 Tax=Mytilus coruscus TaxID=42192 RepID=A0A6J8DWN1_MYTCO|nr:unnamed protein product [Mytilus coruscus]